MGDILLSKINQTNEEKYHMILKIEYKISLICRSKE